MNKYKYIQQADWWKETRKRCIKALDKEWHKRMDEVIIEVLGTEDTVETLLVNAEPGTGDKQLKDYYEKHREASLQKRQNPPRGGRWL